MAERGVCPNRRGPGRRGCGVAVSAVGILLLACGSVLAQAAPRAEMPGPGAAQAQAGGAVTLRAELRRLLNQHPSLRASKDRVNAAREEQTRASAGYYPRVELAGEGGHEVVDSPTTRTTHDDPLNETRRSSTLTVTENLFDGFATTEGRNRADSQLKVAESTYEALRQNLLFEGISNYHGVLRQSRLVALARQNEDVLKRQLRLEDERVRRGSGIAVDVLLAKTRLQLAVERRVQLAGALEEAVARYTQVFGHPPDLKQLREPTITLPSIDQKLDRAIAIAKEKNPLLAVTNNQIEVARHGKEAARAGYFPRVDVVGSANWEENFDGIEGVRRDWSVTLRATWELFSGFATRSGVAAAAFQQAVAQSEHRNKVRKVVEDLQISLQQLKTARRRVELLDNAVNIAQAVFDSRRKLRDAGRETAINVLDAQSEVFAARINLVAAQFDAAVAAYRVLFSTGMLTPEVLGL